MQAFCPGHVVALAYQTHSHSGSRGGLAQGDMQAADDSDLAHWAGMWPPSETEIRRPGGGERSVLSGAGPGPAV